MWIVAFIILIKLGIGAALAFDCAGVRLPSSIVICSDPELMRLADERQEAIYEARARIGEEGFPDLWEDQKVWVRSYAAACRVPPDRPPPIPVPPSITACFKRAGEARLSYIRSYGTGSGSAPPPTQLGSPAPLGRIGPSFDCSKAATPLALMICADTDLTALILSSIKRTGRSFNTWEPLGRRSSKQKTSSLSRRCSNNVECRLLGR